MMNMRRGRYLIDEGQSNRNHNDPFYKNLSHFVIGIMLPQRNRQQRAGLLGALILVSPIDRR